MLRRSRRAARRIASASSGVQRTRRALRVLAMVNTCRSVSNLDCLMQDTV